MHHISIYGLGSMSTKHLNYVQSIVLAIRTFLDQKLNCSGACKSIPDVIIYLFIYFIVKWTSVLKYALALLLDLLRSYLYPHFNNHKSAIRPDVFFFCSMPIWRTNYPHQTKLLFHVYYKVKVPLCSILIVLIDILLVQVRLKQKY